MFLVLPTVLLICMLPISVGGAPAVQVDAVAPSDDTDPLCLGTSKIMAL
jgi:hypothetical protein